MTPREDTRFPWPLFFIVTAASFFAFGMLIKLLDGSPFHIGLFFKVAIGALILCVITGIIFLFSTAEE